MTRRRETTCENLGRQGFTLDDAVRGLFLLHNFTIGFCVEEQAAIQMTAAGDDRYQPTMEEVLDRAGGRSGGSVPLKDALAAVRDDRDRRSR